MRLTIEFDVESDGRQIAEVPELPGVMVYGATRAEAWRAVVAAALRVLADRVANGELDERGLVVDFRSWNVRKPEHVR